MGGVWKLPAVNYAPVRGFYIAGLEVFRNFRGSNSSAIRAPKAIYGMVFRRPNSILAL